jgi:hypothetical protein
MLFNNALECKSRGESPQKIKPQTGTALMVFSAASNERYSRVYRKNYTVFDIKRRHHSSQHIESRCLLGDARIFTRSPITAAIIFYFQIDALF